MSVQFIENNGQRQYAVVPIDVYNDLLENLKCLKIGPFTKKLNWMMMS